MTARRGGRRDSPDAAGAEFPHHLFRAYDIRGAAESDLTADLVERVGRALGVEARRGDGGDGAGDGDGGGIGDGGGDGVGAGAGAGDGDGDGDGENRGIGRPEFVIARDCRASGPALADALARGLMAGGCDVLDIGLAPTPVLYATAAARGGNGIAVTASHNPPPDNGLKMMAGGVTLFDDAIQKLKQRIIDGDGDGDGDGDFSPDSADGNAADVNAAPAAPVLRQEDPLPAYRQKIAADINLARRLKVVIDCGNGAAGVVAPQVFRDLGCEVVELFCAVDAAFPNHHPDPGRPENLRDLTAAVAAHRADFGMAFDGDGDRLGVVSGGGEIIWPDRLMLLFAAQVLSANPGAEILFDVKCSQLLPRAIAAAGGIATMCKTGHSFIKDALRASGAPLAGEMSGHLFFADRWGGFDDAIYAGARLCELLAADKRDPAEVFAALPDTCNTPELRIDMAEGAHHELVAELARELTAGGQFEDGEITAIDGIRVDFARGFGLIRASNTSAAVIMRFEAGDQSQLKKIQSRFRRLLLNARPNLALPF